LCEKFGLLPLEFDGRSDSLYHQFDRAGNLHMEYLNYRGSYSDLPLEDIIETFRLEYDFGRDIPERENASFDADVETEIDATHRGSLSR
jgi:hypothetical protein